MEIKYVKIAGRGFWTEDKQLVATVSNSVCVAFYNSKFQEGNLGIFTKSENNLKRTIDSVISRWADIREVDTLVAGASPLPYIDDLDVIEEQRRIQQIRSELIDSGFKKENMLYYDLGQCSQATITLDPTSGFKPEILPLPEPECTTAEKYIRSIENRLHKPSIPFRHN